MLNSNVKSLLMSVQYFEHYAIICRGGDFCGHGVDHQHDNLLLAAESLQ